MNAEQIADRYMTLGYCYAERLWRRYNQDPKDNSWEDFASAVHLALMNLSSRIDSVDNPEAYLFSRIRGHALHSLQDRLPLGFRWTEQRADAPPVVATFESLEQGARSAALAVDVVAERDDTPSHYERFLESFFGNDPSGGHFEQLLALATEKEAEALRALYAGGLSKNATARALGIGETTFYTSA